MNFLASLASSLLSDPFYQAITVESPNGEHRLQVLREYFNYSVLEGRRTGRVVVAANDQDGAAVWLLPRTSEVQTQEAAGKATAMKELRGERGRNQEFVAQQLRGHGGRDNGNRRCTQPRPETINFVSAHGMLAPTLTGDRPSVAIA